MRTPHTNRRRRNQRTRLGAAVVELAICLPIVMLIVASTLEISSLIFVYQSLQAAAHECSRVAAKREGTIELVQSRLDEILSQRGVSDGVVTVFPDDLDRPRGTRYTITVTAPFTANSFIPPRLLGEKNLEAMCVVVKEL
ncbi:MAG: hypothetical protein ACI9G1_005068 [Pirellulaceae bacterium]|jgi:hypothetical protein